MGGAPPILPQALLALGRNGLVGSLLDDCFGVTLSFTTAGVESLNAALPPAGMPGTGGLWGDP